MQTQLSATPTAGAVTIAAGYDPQLGDTFINFESDLVSYMSPAGISTKDFSKIIQTKLGVELPRPILDGVEEDIVDARMGATDIGRRIVQYREDGTVISRVTY